MAEVLTVTQTVIAGADCAFKQGTGIINYLKRKYGYVKDMTRNYAKLMVEYEKLCAKEYDVKINLAISEEEVDESEECKVWRRKVGEMKDEVETLKTEYVRPSRSRWFFYLMKLGRRIVKMTGEVVSLTNDRNNICNITNKKPLAPFISNFSNKDTESPSVKENVKTLREYLRNEKIKKICVWGPIGVGKSTIMDSLHQEINEAQDFHMVFKVEVGRENGEVHIQQELLKRLKINQENLSYEEKLCKINEKLKIYSSYLLLLDEVFPRFDWKGVGINDQHQGKVVFATRYREVCTGMDEEIEVGRLSDTDAEEMFWKIVGPDFRDYTEIVGEAKLIIQFCSGMPYLIELIGKYLTTKMSVEAEIANNAAILRNTWDELTSTTGEPRQNLEKVYKSLKLEIDRLKPEEKKHCFLYLAIFPIGNELHQDYIIECWRAEQFLKRFETLGKARDGGYSTLREFVDKSLLKKGKVVGRYKMFEFYQRLAFRFAKDENIYIQEIGRKIKWEDATRISMIGNSDFTHLPEEPNSKRVLTLLLHDISCLSQFPTSFFQRMSLLQLLDLYKTKIETLPSSISSLINLKAMFLKNCDQLIELCAEVGDLRTLEILDIRHTGIYNLPSVIKHLIALKCLRVSIRKNIGNQNHVNGGGSREMISPNVFAELHSLEELGIVVDPTDERWDQIVKSIVEQVAELEELTTLCFYFPTLDCFKTFISNSKSWNANNVWRGERLRSFSIIVGPQGGNSLAEFDVSEWSTQRRLRFSAGEAVPDAILKILKKASSFELIAHKAANLSVFSADNLQGLEVCTIKDCPEMTRIIDGDGAVFQWLKKLYIDGLLKLEHIWKNSVIPKRSLILLTNLKLMKCPMLEFLFSEEVAVQLKELQYMQIEQCQVIKEIIEDGSRVEFESSAFPKLKSLELVNLPSLSKICRDVSLKCDSLETLKIDACMELKNFPSTFQRAEKLKDIYCNQNLWDQLVWPDDDNATKIHFGNLHRST